MNNLRKFATEADYSAATLNYPAVSWVVSGDTVHYDKEAPTPPVVNDKVMFATNGDGEGETSIVLYNCGSSGAEGEISSITIDDVAVTPITCFTDSQYDASQVYTVKYVLSEGMPTSIDDWFTGDLGLGGASTPATIDVLYPAHITSIGANFPSNTAKLVCLATTPPYVEGLSSTLPNALIYVPDSAVNDYKSDGSWGEMSEHIYPISEYSGNLPV